MDNTTKIIENYEKICEFLLSHATNAPVGIHVDVNLKKFIGHYSSIEIVHNNGCKAYLRVYEGFGAKCHSPQNYFYAGDDISKIHETILSDRPTLDFMKNLVIGWHRYGIKDIILNAFNSAIAEANEKIEAEKEIDNFVV